MTNENIAQMKISQVGNFSRVKELINKKGHEKKSLRLFNLNNKILKVMKKPKILCP